MILNVKLIIVIISVAFLATSIVAQIRIPIPKIKKPEPANTPPTNGSESTENPAVKPKPSSEFGPSREMVVDDGYTFFDAEPAKEYDSVARGDRDIGWYLKLSLRIFGTFPARSGFNVVVSKNGKNLTKTRCEGKPYRKSDDMSLSTSASRQGKDLSFDNFMQVNGCFDMKQFAVGEGNFDVKVFFFNGDTDAETLVRTYKIDVHRATRVRGSAIAPQADVAHYYIQRHAEAPVAFMQMLYAGINDYFLSADGRPPAYNRIEIYFSYSPQKNAASLPMANIRCSVDGKRIDFSKASYRDQVTLSRRRTEMAFYTDRLADQYKRGAEYSDEVSFIQVRAILPISFGRAEDNDVKLQDFPGLWSCDIMANGNKLRTFQWNVGDDGRPVAHPEQQSGNINLYYNAFLVGVTIPEKGSELDYRLLPLPAAGLFYGIPWSTDDGRDLARKVPTVGRPYHLPSNKR